MDLVVLTETIIKKLVTDPESVSVKEFYSEDEDTMVIQVLISSDDMGKVIGREGKTINAVRTIVQASSWLNGAKKINIKVDEY